MIIRIMNKLRGAIAWAPLTNWPANSPYLRIACLGPLPQSFANAAPCFAAPQRIRQMPNGWSGPRLVLFACAAERAAATIARGTDMLRIHLLLLALTANLACADWGLVDSPFFGSFTQLRRLPGGGLLAGTSGGLHASLDNGDSWFFTRLGSLDDPNAGDEVAFDAVEFEDGEVLVAMEHLYRGTIALDDFDVVPGPFMALESLVAIDDTLLAASSLQIHRSEDRGASWETVFDGAGNWDGILSLQRDPLDGTLVAEMARANGVWFLVSDDHGRTWSQRQVPGVYGAPKGAAFGADGTLWFVNDFQNRSRLRRSADFGASSEIVYEGPLGPELGHLTLGPASRMAMTQGATVVVSLDGGGAFAPVTFPYAAPEALCFSGERLLAGGRSGLSISENEGGDWWLTENGLNASMIVDSEREAGGRLWVLSSGHLWKREAADWEAVPLPEIGVFSASRLRATPGGRLLLLGRSSADGGVCAGHFSADGGANWTPCGGLGQTTYRTFERVMPEPGGGLLASHGDLGLFRSLDDGESWSLLTDSPAGVLDRAGDGTLYVGGQSGVQRSTDGGLSWLPLAGVAATDLHAASTVADVFVVREWMDIKRTTDAGASWTEIGNNLNAALSSAWFTDLQALGYGSDGTLVAVVQAERWGSGRRMTRVLASSNDGDSFVDVTGASGIQAAHAGRLRLAADGQLIAITNQGLYLEDAAVSVEAPTTIRPSGLELLPAAPNPFNPSTRLAFVLPAAGEVRLSVHDLLGRPVALLVDGPLAAGRHEAVFHARNLASGVYVARLAAGSATTVRPMLLVK